MVIDLKSEKYQNKRRMKYSVSLEDVMPLGRNFRFSVFTFRFISSNILTSMIEYAIIEYMIMHRLLCLFFICKEHE